MESHRPSGKISDGDPLACRKNPSSSPFSGPNWSQFPPFYTVHHTHRPHRTSHFCLDTSGFPILSFLPLYTAPLPKYVSVLATIENLSIILCAPWKQQQTQLECAAETQTYITSLSSIFMDPTVHLTSQLSYHISN